MPILPGTDGERKMSKSYGNYIGVTEPPEEIYGKTLRLPDSALATWHELLLGEPLPAAANPRDAKRALARALVARFHDAAAAEEAERAFDRVHVDHRAPEEMPSVALSANGEGLVHLPALLADAFGVSRSEARRSLEQGGVKLDGELARGRFPRSPGGRARRPRPAARQAPLRAALARLSASGRRAAGRRPGRWRTPARPQSTLPPERLFFSEVVPGRPGRPAEGQSGAKGSRASPACAQALYFRARTESGDALACPAEETPPRGTAVFENSTACAPTGRNGPAVVCVQVSKAAARRASASGRTVAPELDPVRCSDGPFVYVGRPQ